MSEVGVKYKVEADLDQATRDIESFSKRSRTALTSLSLVIQDLPYGFIGIQNNLPGVIQTFGELSAKSNGVGNALKELGKSLIGPAGLYLAFSAVTSGVTLLIQKYGSLGAAFDALFGRTYSYVSALNEAQKAQEEFLKTVRDTNDIENQASGQYEASSVRLQTLLGIVLDETKAQNARKNALAQLKELDKDRFANYTLEKSSLQGLTTEVNNYTNALIANAIAKEYEQEIGKTTINLNNQRDALFALQKAFDKLNETYPDLSKKADEYNKTTKRFVIPTDVQKYFDLQKRIKQQNVVVGVEFERQQDLERKFQDALNQVNEFFKPGGGGKVPKIKFDFELPKTEDYKRFVEKFYTPENAISRLEKFADTLLNVNAKEEDRKKILEQLDAETTKVLGKNDNYFQNLMIGVSSYDEITQAVKNYGFALQQAVLDQQKLFDAEQKIKAPTFGISDIKRGLFGDIEAAITNPEIEKSLEDFKDRAKGLNTDIVPSLKELETKLREILTLETFKSEIPLTFQQITKIITDELSKIDTELTKLELDKQLQEQFKNYYDLLDDLANQTKRTYEDIRSYVSQVLTKPLDYLVNTILDKGKVTWKEFADIAVESLKRIAAQVAINAIISAIAAALTPDAGSLIGKLGKMKTSGLADYLNETSFLDIFNMPGAANFGGVQGGAMNGQVVFVQRGSDLVGVLNRTNTNIGRIG